MTYDQALHVVFYIVAGYLVVALVTAIIAACRLTQTYYLKSEMYASSGELWMSGGTVTTLAVFFGLYWPKTWYKWLTPLFSTA